MKLFGLLALALLLSFSVSAQKAKPTPVAQKTPPVKTAPQPQKTPPPSATAASSGPSFAALDMAGQKVDTAALRGKIVVLNLWFVNCPNCVEEIALLNQIVDQYKGNPDVVFVGLAASPKPVLEKFLVKNPFKYQVVPNSQMIIISKFATPDKNGNIEVPFPMHYMLDRNGNVVYKAQGIKGIDGLKTTIAEQIAKK